MPSTHTLGLLATLKKRYDPENDIGPGPRVTHTEYILLLLIEEIVAELEQQEQWLQALQDTLSEHKA